jgi:hypothetical protein
MTTPMIHLVPLPDRDGFVEFCDLEHQTKQCPRCRGRAVGLLIHRQAVQPHGGLVVVTSCLECDGVNA